MFPAFSKRLTPLWPLCAALLALWLALIRLLGAQWSAYQQYNYGWAVPFLCLYFAWNRLRPVSFDVGRSMLDVGCSPPHAPLLSRISRILWSGRSQIANRKSQIANPPSPSLDVGRSMLDVGCSPPPASTFRLFRVFRGSLSAFQLFSFSAFLLLWLPLRILQEANPIWRAASYGLALCACAITLLLIFAEGGPSLVRTLAFPVLFFLVAVPWPSGLEGAIVQTFTRWDTGLTVEILGNLGIPTLQHGNVIETALGSVGVDEACSGIRSFQAAFMLSLALGEVYRLNLRRRIGLLLGGFALAFGFNVARTSLLAYVAARKGLGAEARWHDPAGITIIVACFLSLWVVAAVLGKQKAESRKRKAESRAHGAGGREQGESQIPNRKSQIANPPSPSASGSPLPAPRSLLLRWLSLSLLVWIIFSEVATALWFRAHETHTGPDNSWSVQVPSTSNRYSEVKQTASILHELACDKHVSIGWESEGHSWLLYYFRWLPAHSLLRRVHIALSKTHRPDHCLPASGRKLIQELPPQHVMVHALDFPFRTYLFDDEGVPLFAFQCIHEDGAPIAEVSNLRDNTKTRLLAAWHGERGLGQRSLEVAVWGYRDVNAATAALQRQLEPLIHVETKTPKPQITAR